MDAWSQIDHQEILAILMLACSNDKELCPIMFGVEELPSPLKRLNLLLPCSAPPPRDRHHGRKPQNVFQFPFSFSKPLSKVKYFQNSAQKERRSDNRGEFFLAG
jgi:hypothetical protein